MRKKIAKTETLPKQEEAASDIKAESDVKKDPKEHESLKSEKYIEGGSLSSDQKDLPELPSQSDFVPKTSKSVMQTQNVGDDSMIQDSKQKSETLNEAAPSEEQLYTLAPTTAELQTKKVNELPNRWYYIGW